MTNYSPHIRKLQSQDIPDAMELVLAEGWNQTELDWQILMGSPQNVCLVAEVGNKFAGTATAINFNNKVAWVGMVLVNKVFRGRGISQVMLSTLFKHLESCESIKLDATPAGQPVYKKLGFEEEYPIDRMTCLSFGQTFSFSSHSIPQKIQKNDIPAIIELDEYAFGANRSQLIEALIRNSPEKCFLLKNDNLTTGFVLGRTGNRFHHIGPLIASSTFQALQLMQHTLKGLHGKAIVIDVPADKNEFVNWLTSLGFSKQRYFSRMYQSSNLFPGNPALQHLICGPEFG